MNYDPRDPNNLAFFTTFIAQDEPRRKHHRPGVFIWVVLTLIFLGAMLLH